ncbi:MAG TPA: glutamate 5-kinase [Rhizomicrobium sp.]|jgi:glutamate 5-kinase
MSDIFAASKLVVVKVGSALLVDGAKGELRRDWLASLCDDVAALKNRGIAVVLVSSGSIALGRRLLKLPAGELRLEESQAAAAAGQVRLAEAYADMFASRGIVAAQVLLTFGDTEERRRYLNARATLGTLVGLGAVPVINENDTVATAEIKFGDNDRLGARVASMMGADKLVLLSDVDGLYTADPSRDRSATHIPEVSAITPEIEAMAGGSVSGFGRGGMTSKLIAAKIAMGAGCDVILAKGETRNPLSSLDLSSSSGGARHTLFRASLTPAAARKRWIAGVLRPEGALVIDEGAVRALKEGKSLLPAGIRQIDGRFERGDAVVVKDRDGREIARGLVAYNASDAEQIAGKRTVEIEAILGYRGRDEMIHRDDLILTGNGI